MIRVHTIPVTPFMQNCTVLECLESGKVIVCDCGDAAPVLEYIEAHKYEVEAVWATHGHLDHIGGTAKLMEAYNIPFYFHRGDDFLREDLPNHARMYGFPPVKIPPVTYDIAGQSEICFGSQKMEIRHCPGHTPGHVVFYSKPSSVLIAGDVLFQGSIGRTDFPRGSFEQLKESIQKKIYVLPDDTVVHCGHGPTTTIGVEANSNPFVTRL